MLYDGPLRGPGTLWRIVAEEGVTVFGTSPPYLQLCEDSGYSPRRDEPPRALRSVLSTGSILRDWQYDWVGGRSGGAAAVDLGRHRHHRLLRARATRTCPSAAA